MAAVEGEAVALADGVVPVRLEFVDAVGDEAGGGVRVGGVVVVAGVERGLVVVVVLGGGCGWGEGCSVEMEAEERVGVEVVEGCPGTVPVICEFGVAAVAGDGIFCPFGDVGF